MKFILSPSKRQVANPSTGQLPEPHFLKDAERIAKQMKKLSARQLANRLGLSDKLSAEVYEIWQAWAPEGGTPSLAMFQGDVYDGLDFDSLSDSEKKYALENSYIASALFGVLRGSDSVSPYRLDLNDKVKVGSSTLLSFWKKKKDDFNVDASLLVDLTSSEYTPLIPKDDSLRLVRVDFKEEKGGKLKTVSFFSKKARGQFARWMVQSGVNDLNQLKDFNLDGYQLNSEVSSENLLVFSRLG